MNTRRYSFGRLLPFLLLLTVSGSSLFTREAFASSDLVNRKHELEIKRNDLEEQLETSTSEPVRQVLEDDLIKTKLELLEVEVSAEEAKDEVKRRGAATDEVVTVKTFFATTRAFHQGTNGEVTIPEFSGERGSELTFGTYQISVPLARAIGAPVVPANWTRKKAGALSENIKEPISILPQRHWVNQLKEASKPADPKKSALLFVHGYRTGFNEAAARSAQIAVDIGLLGPIVLFSWPSKNNFALYKQDETEVEWTERYFEEAIKTIAQTEVENLVIFAHSMGSRLVARVLTSLAKTGELPRNIRKIVLAAPDIDAGTFWGNYAPYLATVSGLKLSIYMSQNDLAIRASRILGGYPRLGDPSSLPRNPTSIELIDASPATSWVKAVGHSYIFDTREVIHDLWSSITQGIPPGRRPWLLPLRKPNNVQVWKIRK